MDVARQLLDSIQQISEIDGRNAEGFKGSKGYEGDVQEIEASPSEQEERYQSFEFRYLSREVFKSIIHLIRIIVIV
jgi:hypothetical protein